MRVVEEPSVLSHHPVAIAVGDAHANVPLTIVGVNLPGGGSGSGAGGGGPTGAGQTAEDFDARCVGHVVGRGERSTFTSVSAVAITVSSAVMICPPFDWVDDRDVGTGSALAVEVGWNGVASSNPTSSAASTSVEVEILRIPASPNGVAPTSTSAVGGGVITVAWSEDRPEGDAIFVGATCAFGTVSGIPARTSAKTATDETAETDDAQKRPKTPQPTCVAPATGAARVGVPVRVAWRSKASRVVGLIDFAPPAVPTTALALKPVPTAVPTDATASTVVAAAATASYPPAFAAGGGSLASVRTRLWSPRNGRLSVRCAFFAPGDSSRTDRRFFVSYAARVVSSALATCETPGVSAVGSGGSVSLIAGRSAGVGGWDVEAAVLAAVEAYADNGQSQTAAWIETPAVFDVVPRVASVAGGRAITARGRSFGVAERVGVWVGTIGPLRARSIDDDDEAGGPGGGGDKRG